MHRLTNAVLIFDEIQSLPKQCKVLFERAIRFLNVYGHSTVILCTATQPKLSSALSAVELMPNVDALYTQLKRVHFVSQLDRNRTYASAGKDIAQILKDKSVLAILNTKAAAWRVYQETVKTLKGQGAVFVAFDKSVPEKDIPRIAEETGAELIILAMPSVDMQTKKRILGICSETMCEVKKLPYIHELVEGTLLGQTRKINIEDLLGRDVVRFDSDRSKNLIAGKTCMVTGGGGSIGSELCRQIAALSPAKLVIVDIYENNAYDIQQELLIKYGKGLPLEVHIASVRDLDKMDRIFADVRPELVFHAAAHKHVPLMENDPEEAIKNNVQGTYHCAMLADKYGADKFVLVSTDKAVNPTNVMGASKRCCEMIVQYFAQKHPGTEFVAVRFGNVLGSNGSVIPLFERQIESGGPITVTHPDIIRYFMTIPEAVSLILQAGAMARGGEIFVLDMGEPVKILSLAENLIRLHGKEPYVDINIEFSGLRPGEKLFEELLMDEEGLRKTENEKIFIGRQIDIDSETFREELEDIIECAKHNDGDAVVAKLRKIVPTFSHVVINK